MMVYVDIFLIIVSLAVTIFLLRKQVNLGFVMLIDTVFLAVIARIPLNDTLRYSFEGLISVSTIKLILILFLIMMIENIMRNSGMIKVMVDNLKEIIGDNRYAAGLMPLVLGLLPSPGGARFSCPMVSEITRENTDDENKSYINYWFRHIWLDGFILYPGIILASELLRVSVINMFLHLLPFMAFNLIIGYFFGLSKMRKEKIARTKPLKESFKVFLYALLPVIIVIVIYILLLNVTSYSLEIASVAVMIALLIIKKYSFKKILKTAREAFPVKLILIIIGVMVFKEVLLDSGAIDELPALMSSYGIPVSILYVLLPFVGAFTSGITVSFVSLTFPILISLGLRSNLWFATVAYIFGFLGNMITPLHLCAVMTADYFESSLTSLLKRVIISSIPLFLAGITVLLLTVFLG